MALLHLPLALLGAQPGQGRRAQHLDVLRRPVPCHRVDDAGAAEHVPVVADDREAGVGADPQQLHRRVVATARVRAGVADQQRRRASSWYGQKERPTGCSRPAAGSTPYWDSQNERWSSTSVRNASGVRSSRAASAVRPSREA